jgi:hypothetical protein
VPLVRLAVAACVLLVLAACGTSRASDAAHQALTNPAPADAAQESGYQPRGEVTRSIVEDVTLSVSTPTLFTPTEEAYPKAVRAVAFELVLDNQSDTVYRPAQLSFVATADGVPVDQIIDSTQGYSGVMGTDEVLPSQTLRFSVAFGVPEQTCVVRVTVRPETAATHVIPLFDGTI